MATTSMLPHRRVDDTDSDRNLRSIADRSCSFRIEPIVLPLLYEIRWMITLPQIYADEDGLIIRIIRANLWQAKPVSPSRFD